METDLVDVKALHEDARNSMHGESYRVVNRSHDCRIGVGARLAHEKTSFFIDILVNLCPDSHEVDLSLLEKKLRLLRELKLRGYSMSCQDYGSILCELDISPKEIVAEYRTVKSMIKRTLKQREN